ncbi:MAG: tRNA pseudouridine(55) synthase TruB [Deltaproteobacteria bacterium]|nr:tRNA pseudouridine(55) synthase TruB [Deltaproteobacteria bacterium]
MNISPKIHGKAVQDENLCGFIVVNKPAGMTSAKVVNRLKHLPGVHKAGHTGTLDPFATGVMVCPVNRATRLSRFFLHGSKTYKAKMVLGIETDSQDYTGKVLKSSPVEDIAIDRIEAAFMAFTGTTEQVPPAFSALKHKGVPLYRYARAGNPIEKPARQILISSLEILDIRLPEIEFCVTCSAGTYIRTLSADIGKKLGCGAHLAGLIRTRACGFTLDEALSLDELCEIDSADRLHGLVVPMANALFSMPACIAGRDAEEKIAFGVPITPADIKPLESEVTSPYIKVIDGQNRLLAVIEPVENKFEYHYCCVFHYAQSL